MEEGRWAMMEAAVKYIEGGREDLETARGLISIAKPYWVHFLCHQALYKILRGVYLEKFNKYPIIEQYLPKLVASALPDFQLSDDEENLLHELSFYADIMSHSVYREKIISRSVFATESLKCSIALSEKIIQVLP
jgi:HEPN domain-containing protein